MHKEKRTPNLRFIDSLLLIIDLLRGLSEEPFSNMALVHQNSPFALMGRFPSLMGRFPSLMGHSPPLLGCFPDCLNEPFSLPKIPWKTAHQERAH